MRRQSFKAAVLAAGFLRKTGDRMGRVAALDGLRAIAALAVVFHHGLGFSVLAKDGWQVWSPGAVGVRLFFVLSGFLITDILIRARADAHLAGVSLWSVWRAFLLRRSVRIFPVAYLALAVAWAIGLPAAREHGWWYVAYGSNIHMASWPAHADSGIGHFWSLAVEEHFYLLWPVLLFLTPQRTWRSLIIGLLVAVAIARVWGALTLGPWPTYILTWMRADALALGGLLAIAQPRIATVAGIAAMLLAVGWSLPAGPLWLSLQETAAVCLSGCAVLVVARGRCSWLGVRPLLYVGTISYGLYVWHYLIPFLVPGVPPEGGLIRLGYMAVGGTLLASASWHFFEKPFNELKVRWPYVATTPRAPAMAAVRGEIV